MLVYTAGDKSKRLDVNFHFKHSTVQWSESHITLKPCSEGNPQTSVLYGSFQHAWALAWASPPFIRSLGRFAPKIGAVTEVGALGPPEALWILEL